MSSPSFLLDSEKEWQHGFKAGGSFPWHLLLLISCTSNLFLRTEVPPLPLPLKTCLVLSSLSSLIHLSRLPLWVCFPSTAWSISPYAGRTSTLWTHCPVQTWVVAYMLLFHAYFHLFYLHSPNWGFLWTGTGVLRCTLYASHSIWHWLVTKQMSGECGDKLTKTSPLITSKFPDWCVTRHLEQVVGGYGRTSGLHQGRTGSWGYSGGQWARLGFRR